MIDSIFQVGDRQGHPCLIPHVIGDRHVLAVERDGGFTKAQKIKRRAGAPTAQGARATLQLLKAREQLQTKERHVVGLEVLLGELLERIDRLTVQVDQLRAQNQKLDAECEHLAELVRSEGTITELKRRRGI